MFGDFCVATFGTPVTFIASIYREWIFGDQICVIYGFFMSVLGQYWVHKKKQLRLGFSSHRHFLIFVHTIDLFSGINSITSLSVLAIEWYITITSPLSKKINSTSAIALIGLYSFAVTSPPLFGWGDYVHEAANIRWMWTQHILHLMFIHC